ncbi:MAG: cation transporter [Proteobacteria bacterium]|jgi:cation diffusion facilitator family transporter|nr:cation transporter [Pseudomonadota bacterium]
MSAHCHDHGVDEHQAQDKQYRNILWIVFVLNAGMFGVEIIAGALVGSVSLQADALDFFADAGNYLIALFVLGRSIQWRAGAALFKGSAMGVFGLYVLGFSLYQTMSDTVPVAPVMGIVGTLALIANVASAVLLFRHRGGDSNRQSVWLCSRNDAIANVAVIVAAGLVYLTATHWPDLVVGFFMAALSLHSAWEIIRQATSELKTGETVPAE